MEIIINLILLLCTVTMLWVSNEHSRLVKKINGLANELYALERKNKTIDSLTCEDVKKIRLLAQEQKEAAAIEMAIEAIKATESITDNRSIKKSDTRAKLILCLDVIKKIPEKDRTEQIKNIGTSLAVSIIYSDIMKK